MTQTPKPQIKTTEADKTQLLIMPKLAQEIGLNESIVLMQIAFWIGIADNYRDGKWWVYKSTYEMAEITFLFWSAATINRAINSLLDKNLLHVTEKYNKRASDKTRWFALNIAEIQKLNCVTIKDDKGHPITLTQIASSPTQNEASPTQIASSPMQNEAATLMQDEASPMQDEASPTQIASSPTQNEAATLMQDEASPMQDEASPTQDEASPTQNEATLPETTKTTKITTENLKEKEKEKNAPAPACTPAPVRESQMPKKQKPKATPADADDSISILSAKESEDTQSVPKRKKIQIMPLVETKPEASESPAKLPKKKKSDDNVDPLQTTTAMVKAIAYAFATKDEFGGLNAQLRQQLLGKHKKGKRKEYNLEEAATAIEVVGFKFFRDSVYPDAKVPKGAESLYERFLEYRGDKRYERGLELGADKLRELLGIETPQPEEAEEKLASPERIDAALKMLQEKFIDPAFERTKLASMTTEEYFDYRHQQRLERRKREAQQQSNLGQ